MRSKLRSGQSLVEMALSMTVLIFLFQGVWDLGRAYYALVMLNNAVSEGAHWAAQYPACINGAYDSTGSADSLVYPQCDGSNSIVGRIVNEEQTLDQSKFTHVCWSTLNTLGTSGGFGNTNGNTVTISATYNATFVTPLLSGLFGSSVPLTAEVREVIRGGSTSSTDLPSSPVYNGTSYQGGVAKSSCTPP